MSRIWWYGHGSRKRGVAVSEKLILTCCDIQLNAWKKEHSMRWRELEHQQMQYLYSQLQCTTRSLVTL